jgi:hypothetical protein
VTPFFFIASGTTTLESEAFAIEKLSRIVQVVHPQHTHTDHFAVSQASHASVMIPIAAKRPKS